MILPIALGILLAIVHYFSEKFHLLSNINRMKFISFTSGVFISYIILHLIPDIFVEDIILNRISLMFVLIGFSVFHLLEKYVYKHDYGNQEKMRRELKEVHSLAFFIYHFIIGIVLVTVFNESGIQSAILFYIPLIFITSVSSLSLKEIHGKIRGKPVVKFLLSVSTLLGIIISSLFPLSQFLYGTLLGFVVGALLYIVITDSIPKEKEGMPVFFVVGVALYSLLIAATWLV